MELQQGKAGGEGKAVPQRAVGMALLSRAVGTAPSCQRERWDTAGHRAGGAVWGRDWAQGSFRVPSYWRSSVIP